MTVKRRPKGRGKAAHEADALTLEEWKRRKSNETAGTAPEKPKNASYKAKTTRPK